MGFIDVFRTESRALIRPISVLAATVARRASLLTAVGLGFLVWPSIAAAQNDLSELIDECASVGIAVESPAAEMEALDACKRALEIRALQADADAWPEWFIAAVSAGLALVVGIVSGFLTNRFALRQARLKMVHELDQAVHAQRIQLYPKLTKTAEPFAVYFPPDGETEPEDVEGVTKITPAVCKKIGRQMSTWYFCDGGLLLSPQARDSYFNFARALTRASKERELMVPQFPKQANQVSSEMLKKCRQHLKIRSYSQKQVEPDPVRRERDLAEVEGWRFGNESAGTEPGRVPASEDEETALAQEFKDYVFLQQLSSLLRTELTYDIRSRRRPAG